MKYKRSKYNAMDEIEPKHLEEVLQTLEEELQKMNPPELRVLEEEIAKESAAEAKKQMEEIQQLKPKERDFFRKRLAQELAKLRPIFEKWHKQEVENTRRGYILFKGKKLKKNYRYFIPCTEEEWKERTEKRAQNKINARMLKETNSYLRTHLPELFAIA